MIPLGLSCRVGSCMNAFSSGGALEGIRLRVFQTSGERISPLMQNKTLFNSSLLSQFIEKKHLHGNMRTYKIEGDLSKYTHKLKKGELFMLFNHIWSEGA
jgi:hypothetical protein